MMRLDGGHVTIAALRRLVPDATCAGGSFAASLPHPSTLTPSARAAALESAQQAAVAQCIRSLLGGVGLPEDLRVDRGSGGDRDWPPGFVGSLTHKGTVVLGVIAEISSIHMVGIDLERMDGADLGPIERMVAWEGLPRGIEPQLGMLLVFSAKEAVFKAQYPVNRRRLDFSDVKLVWADPQGDTFRAEVLRPTRALAVQSVRVDHWVLSVAIST